MQSRSHLAGLEGADDDRVRARVQNAFRIAETPPVGTSGQGLAVLRYHVLAYPTFRYHGDVDLKLQEKNIGGVNTTKSRLSRKSHLGGRTTQLARESYDKTKRDKIQVK